MSESAASREVTGEFVRVDVTDVGPEVSIYSDAGFMLTVVFPAADDAELARDASELAVDDTVTVAWHTATGEHADGFGTRLDLVT